MKLSNKLKFSFKFAAIITLIWQYDVIHFRNDGSN